MGRRINAYIDIASFYSYVAFLFLIQNAPNYAAHNVEVVYHPVLLGAINQASGNKPPFSLPAKARHGAYDVRRTCERVGLCNVQAPPDFMKRAVNILALRALHYIKRHHDADTYVTTFHYLFYRFWTPPNADLRDTEVLRSVLADVRVGFNGNPEAVASARPIFTASDINAILTAATQQAAKDQLTAATKEALDRGAYGAPWMWVRNDAGEEEPFFGSDRFHFVYKFLGLPYQDVALLPAPSGARDQKL